MTVSTRPTMDVLGSGPQYRESRLAGASPRTTSVPVCTIADCSPSNLRLSMLGTGSPGSATTRLIIIGGVPGASPGRGGVRRATMSPTRRARPRRRARTRSLGFSVGIMLVPSTVRSKNWWRRAKMAPPTAATEAPAGTQLRPRRGVFVARRVPPAKVGVCWFMKADQISSPNMVVGA